MTVAYQLTEAGTLLSRTTVERRPLGPRDVRLDLKFCGICHSDLVAASDKLGGGMFPMVPGHEMVGVITEMGTDVTGVANLPEGTEMVMPGDNVEMTVELITPIAMDKELRSKLYFLECAPMLFISALTGQRVERIFPLAVLAVEQHRRRVSTAVVNEVLQEALSWRSPPTTRGGRQGRLYYGTQVAVRPPSFTLFVNEPKLFGDTYRRYVERQIRQGLGFEGSPVRLFWRGKQQRDAERDQARAASR